MAGCRWSGCREAGEAGETGVPTSTVGGSSSDMVDVLNGDVDHRCRDSNFTVDGCTHPVPEQAGEGRDGRGRGNADSQIDGDLCGRRNHLRLARVKSWRTLIQRVVSAEHDCAAAGFEAVDLVAGASDEVGEGLLAD